MGLFQDFVKGVTNSALAAMGTRRAAATARDRDRIERLSHELGWSVDEREGNAIRLHFNSSDGEVRKVRIANGDKSIVGFYAHSDAVLPVRRLPPDLLAYLLRRNLEDSGIGMWGMAVDDEDDVTFHLCYMALGDGLNADMLKGICESLANEAGDFDDKLRKAGLLD